MVEYNSKSKVLDLFLHFEMTVLGYWDDGTEVDAGGACFWLATATPSKRGLNSWYKASYFSWVAYTRERGVARVGGKRNGVRERKKKRARFLATRGPELVPAKFNSASNNFTAIAVVTMETNWGKSRK